MKTFVLILSFLALTVSATLAGQIEILPNGQTVYIPQHQTIPAQPYYSPRGGPPLGTVFKHNGVQTFVPNNLPRPQGFEDQ